jgi:nucleoside-diphosphate-sugar epimerase
LILGPVPNKDVRTSIELVRTLMLGQVPGVGRIKMGMVDVRDVASAIILAMNTPEAAGNRFLVAADKSMWLKDIADLLYEKYAARGYKINRIQFPSLLVRLIALFDKKVSRVTESLDWDYELSNEKAKRVLKWTPRSAEESILSMAESLIEQGFV